MIEHTSDFLFLPSELKMQIRFHVHFLFSRQLILIHHQLILIQHQLILIQHQLILIQHQLILIQPSARDLPLGVLMEETKNRMCVRSSHQPDSFFLQANQTSIRASLICVIRQTDKSDCL